MTQLGHIQDVTVSSSLCVYVVQMSRAALQRYLFYCNRYMNHWQSLRFEHKVCEYMLLLAVV